MNKSQCRDLILREVQFSLSRELIDVIFQLGVEFLPKAIQDIEIQKILVERDSNTELSHSHPLDVPYVFDLKSETFVLQYCIIGEQNLDGHNFFQSFLNSSRRTSNVFLLEIKATQLVFQFWRGFDKIEIISARGADIQFGTILEIARAFQLIFENNWNIPTNSAAFANVLASQSRLCASIAKERLLLEWGLYQNHVANDSRDKNIAQNDEREQFEQRYAQVFPMLELYFTYYDADFSGHDKKMHIAADEFSDILAQTMSYGLWSARWMSQKSTCTFEIQNIHMLVPSTSACIKKMFLNILEVKCGISFDICIKEMFFFLRHTDMQRIFANYTRDPVLYFYEDFLQAYDKNLKKVRGVFYTPPEVVRFMVRSIDEQLKTVYGLPLGLASTKTWEEVQSHLNSISDRESPTKNQIPDMAKRDDVFVRILDPATGTGTFFLCVLDHIRNTLRNHWKCLGYSVEQMTVEWSAYLLGGEGLEKDYRDQGLLSRLFAFEYMMIPYVIAHLRMGWFLQEDEELPFVLGEDDRFHICRTDALEHPNDTNFCSQNMFQFDSANEKKLVASIKTGVPITVILGNPPYQGDSSNQKTWIMNLLNSYKLEPNSVNRLQEAQIRWINDDYIKFIRMAQDYVERSNTGILCFINPHSFISNPTFRGVRWNLWKGFETIYILDLHGNARKTAGTAKDQKDENIFDIMQGVSINIFVQAKQLNICTNTNISKQRQNYGDVFYADVYGTVQSKYTYLENHNISSIPWKEIPTWKDYWNYHFMIPKKTDSIQSYFSGFSLDSIFMKEKQTTHSVGCITGWDDFFVAFSKEELLQKVEDLCSLGVSEFQKKYSYSGKMARKIQNIKTNLLHVSEVDVQKVSYRPFDQRYLYFDKKLLVRPQYAVMRNFLHDSNTNPTKTKHIGIVLSKKVNASATYQHVFVTNTICESCLISNKTGEIGYCFPIVVFDEQGESKRNLNPKIVSKIEDIVGNTIESEHVLDYIYAILYNSTYRQRFFHFLSFMFPYIPYPKHHHFWNMVEKGKKLRMLHLFSDDILKDVSSKLRNTDGAIHQKNTIITNVTIKKTRTQGKGQIWINQREYFDDVSLLAWNFSIGSYQPLQNWLKDRKGRILLDTEIMHYSKMIVVIEESISTMAEIDRLEVNF